MEELPRPQRHPGLRHRLPGGVHQPLPRPLCRHYSPERIRYPDLPVTRKITLNEAIYAYTQASAFAEFREHQKGRLEPGYLADLIVLDRDITTATPQQLLRTKVLNTIVNGEAVYSQSPKPMQSPKPKAGASN
ncbi:amidohydrolase family protein [Tunturiibacter gelidiferens]|uniref:amidohydrolase family protein n=1 Tax=Tunturiibacter gelidiferens TaxID=3069689 RepID=UPI003D9BC3FF